MSNFNFIGRRKVWFIASALVFVVAMASLFTQGLNLGIDFTGGTILDARFAKPVTTAAVRGVLAQFHLQNSIIQATGKSGHEVLITMPVISEHERGNLDAALTKHLGPFQTISLNKVTGVISATLVRQGILAVIIASLLIIVYMAIRFNARFALTGIAAVFYDALVSVGIISLLRVQVSSAFVAAVLTIIGYSINDRIIIFDRIRENLGRRNKESVAEVANRSLNQTLVRSINTAATVIIAMLAILLFGGATTRDFAITMVVGVFFGAYSSIFVAAPLWVTWMERDEAERARSAAAGKAAAAKVLAGPAPAPASMANPVPVAQGGGEPGPRPAGPKGGGKKKKSRRQRKGGR